MKVGFNEQEEIYSRESDLVGRRCAFGLRGSGEGQAPEEEEVHDLRVIRCLSTEYKDEVGGDEEHLTCRPVLGEFNFA